MLITLEQQGCFQVVSEPDKHAGFSSNLHLAAWGSLHSRGQSQRDKPQRSREATLEILIDEYSIHLLIISWIILTRGCWRRNRDSHIACPKCNKQPTNWQAQFHIFIYASSQSTSDHCTGNFRSNSPQGCNWNLVSKGCNWKAQKTQALALDFY